MWAVLVSTIFCIPCKESLPGIWSIQFCVSFLIIPNPPITSRKNFVLIFYILVTSISRSLYFERFWNSFSEMLWSEGTDTSIMMQFRSSWFSIIIYIIIIIILINFDSRERWNHIVWLHFFLLLLIPVHADTFSQCVISNNNYIVSSVKILLFSRLAEGILCLQLWDILI